MFSLHSISRVLFTVGCNLLLLVADISTCVATDAIFELLRRWLSVQLFSEPEDSKFYPYDIFLLRFKGIIRLPES